jgi:Domain of unknown function (DUF1963)
MLSADQVLALAHEEGLDEWADDLLDRVRVGWRIVPSGEPPSPGASKVGGSPDLAEDESWPMARRGIPMAFVAQINCRALLAPPPEWQARAHPWRHRDQFVRVFTNVLDDPEIGRARALACDPGSALRQAIAPTVPDPWPAGGSWDNLSPLDRVALYVLPETAVRFEPFLTAPELHPVLRQEIHQFDELAERYAQWAYRLRIDGAPNDGEGPVQPWEVNHVLGEATSIQDDVRSSGAMLHQDGGQDWSVARDVPADAALADEDAWQVLLALHTGDLLRLEIFDGGAIHILAPAADLADGNLERLVYATSSG